jgi:broad specificity phosphatase PhoE
MRPVVPLLVALWCAALPSLASAQAAVIVVRHAERADASADSLLSAAGEARAGRLAAMLEDAGIAAIYTTERRRTIQTAQPLAEILHLTPTMLKGEDLDGLISRVQAAKPGDRILIVGHSNTVPTILQRLGVTEPITVDDGDFGNVFVVTPAPGSPPQLLHLRF